jgi:putative membrane protein
MGVTAIVDDMAGRTIRAVASSLVSRRLDLDVAGSEHLPARGPVIIVARHQHHVYDGAALIATVPRRLHVVVALDWARTRFERRLMEWAVRTARWPAVLRDAALAAAPSAYGRHEIAGRVLGAVRAAVALLADGAAVLVFPEGFPNLDPRWTPKRTPDEMLPFRPGFAVVAEIARRRLGFDVPIVPAGIAHAPGVRWRTSLRFGAPLPALPQSALTRLAESRVYALSGLPEPSASALASARIASRSSARHGPSREEAPSGPEPRRDAPRAPSGTRHARARARS